MNGVLSTILSPLSLVLALLFVQSVPTTAREDTTSPAISFYYSCGGYRITIIVTDSTEADLGLRSVRFYPSTTGNIEKVSGPDLVSGVGVYAVDVELKNPEHEGKGLLIAEDLAGNIDTLNVVLRVNIPLISSALIELRGVKRNHEEKATITLQNSSAEHLMVVDSLRLSKGNRFTIQGMGNGAIVRDSIMPGELYEIDLAFRSALRGAFDDTLLLYIDCRLYRIALHAEMAEPLIAMESLDFFQVPVGTTTCEELLLANSGSDTLDIATIEVGGEYRFDTTQLPDLPRRLAPGESFAIPICFLPRRLGLQLGRVTVISSAANRDSGVAQLLGVGINSFAASGFDDNEQEVQLAVVARESFLTVVATDRSRLLERPVIYNMKGETIPVLDVQQIGEGWWQLRLPGRLTSGIYLFYAKAEGDAPFLVKFVVM